MKLKIRFPAEAQFDVVGMGLNAVDHLCVVPGYPRFNSKVKMLEYSKQGGGQVATAMVTCVRLGLKAKYIGKVGDDDYGTFSLESLKKEGVDISDVMVEKYANSQFAFILIENGSGERTIIWNRDDRLKIHLNQLKKESVCSGKVLHLDTHEVEASIQAARWAQEEGIPVMLDAEKVKEGTADLLKWVDILIADSTFPKKMIGCEDMMTCLQKLKKLGPSFVCVTLGKEGSCALYGEAMFKSTAFRVECKDTTGAGDVFHGAFIFGMLQNWEIEEILRFSHAAASLKCRTLGGRSGIPTLSEVMQFIKRKSNCITEVDMHQTP
jgi:sugar/nucleoside kinase (ribokinase family)